MDITRCTRQIATTNLLFWHVSNVKRQYPQTIRKICSTWKNEFSKKSIYRVADLGIPRDVTANIRSIKPPHSHHGVALPIYRAQFELCDQMGQFSKAIAAERRWIDCRFQLHGQDYLDEQTGFGYERLGDVLVKGRDWKGALEAYQRAVRALMIARGESSEPYSKCAMEKVVFVQKQWKSPMQKSGPFCALCGCVAVNKCGRCGLVVHCCRDHQTFHWKSVHRQTCAKLT